jgi:hypothetical protein
VSAFEACYGVVNVNPHEGHAFVKLEDLRECVPRLAPHAKPDAAATQIDRFPRQTASIGVDRCDRRSLIDFDTLEMDILKRAHRAGHAPAELVPVRFVGSVQQSPSRRVHGASVHERFLSEQA